MLLLWFLLPAAKPQIPARNPTHTYPQVRSAPGAGSCGLQQQCRGFSRQGSHISRSILVPRMEPVAGALYIACAAVVGLCCAHHITADRKKLTSPPGPALCIQHEQVHNTITALELFGLRCMLLSFLGPQLAPVLFATNSKAHKTVSITSPWLTAHILTRYLTLTSI